MTGWSWTKVTMMVDETERKWRWGWIGVRTEVNRSDDEGEQKWLRRWTEETIKDVLCIVFRQVHVHDGRVALPEWDMYRRGLPVWRRQRLRGRKRRAARELSRPFIGTMSCAARCLFAWTYDPSEYILFHGQSFVSVEIWCAWWRWMGQNCLLLCLRAYV